MTILDRPPAPAGQPAGSVGPPRATPRTIPAGAPQASPAAPPLDLIPTLLGALAVLAGTLAIPPMIVGNSWVGATIEVVLVIWAVGVGARLARVPVVVVIILQLLGAAVALTALYTVGGIGGVIPNGAVLGEAGELLAGAWDQIRTNVSPAPSSTELSFLICLSVGATALIVDILIAICRAPALVALPLLCVYSVPASMDLQMLPWEAFAAPAMLYSVLLVASGLAGRRHGTGAGLAQVINGVGLAGLATVIALLLAGSVTGVGTEGRLPRTSSGSSTGIGLSPFASLKSSLQQSEPVEVLRVSGLDSPHYLRTMTLPTVTADYVWKLDSLTEDDLPSGADLSGQQLVSITASGYRDQFLPIYNGTDAISGIDSGWTYDAALEMVHRPEATTPAPYQVSTSFAQPSAEDLRADTVTPGGELTETGDLPAEAVTIANDVTAGASNAFDKAEALRSYFTDPANGFKYSLDVPDSPTDDALVNFLTNKQGFCQQYASAMAVMLRAVGIPARVAIGYTQGSQDADGSYVITSNDAHAWVEVDFDSAGWVQFDPTPLGGGQGGQQGFTDNGEAAPTTEVTASAADIAPGLQPDIEGDNSGPTAAPSSAGTAAAGSADNEPIVPAWMWWSLIGILLVAAAAAGPTVVRRRRRQQRLQLAEAGGPAGAAAAWREIEDLAVDHGIGLNPAESARATANRLAKAAHLHNQGRAELRAVVQAAEQGWYGPEQGGDGDGLDPVQSVGSPGIGTLERPALVTNLAPAARTMAAELQHTVPLSMVDRLIPKSVRPAWWRF